MKLSFPEKAGYQVKFSVAPPITIQRFYPPNLLYPPKLFQVEEEE